MNLLLWGYSRIHFLNFMRMSLYFTIRTYIDRRRWLNHLLISHGTIWHNLYRNWITSLWSVKISCPHSRPEVNSDVTERHRADKKSILFAQVRPADCTPRPATTTVWTEFSVWRDFRASGTGADENVRCKGDGDRGRRGPRTGAMGGRRMMYRVVELGSNCSGKWPRLESARAASRRVRKPLRLFLILVFFTRSRQDLADKRRRRRALWFIGIGYVSVCFLVFTLVVTATGGRA